MTMNFRILVLAAGFTAAGAMAASAATTLDFTDGNVGGGAGGVYTTATGASATGTVLDTVLWTVTPTPSEGPLTYTAYDGTSGTSPLTNTIDGIGIVDDEVTNPDEHLTLSFSTAVSVSAIHVLDLFGDESVKVVINGVDYILNALGVYDGGAFDGFATLVLDAPVTTTMIEFYAGIGNDFGNGLGNPDFALAGVDVATVPVPAGGLLLIGALGGLAALRRRKSS